MRQKNIKIKKYIEKIFKLMDSSLKCYLALWIEQDLSCPILIFADCVLFFTHLPLKYRKMIFLFNKISFILFFLCMWGKRRNFFPVFHPIYCTFANRVADNFLISQGDFQYINCFVTGYFYCIFQSLCGLSGLDLADIKITV